ncbi:glycosyltransferase [Capnocytophaga gingivalis]|jgi:glycosyltransferase, group 2 family|uniref:glycosyltransferase n=1 Tax=Capnocytophaga gingivalis TaxID=1017 RepID=UPI002B48CA12|nr:glycosyltransferase [Capnocytophaga gingivalis]MEB3013396.1 glycosyltransferase [Capnocytophaga gingivalis]
MISVCIATYNGEKYIKEQLQSILQQLSEGDEIIISDDGSTDNTIKIIEDLNDNRIRILQHIKKSYKGFSSSHQYSSSNFENAIKEAKGEYIFLSDQDDIWDVHKVKKTLEILSDKNLYLVMSNYSLIDTEGILIKKKMFEKNPISNSNLINLIKTPFHGCCITFKKNILKDILPFPSKLVLHDNWIGFLAKGHIKYIEEPLVLYRRHDKNVSARKGESKNPLWYKIYYRIVFYMQYIRRSFKNII